MTIPSGLQAAVEDKIGERILGAARVAGGDVNVAWRARAASGRSLFVKTNTEAPGRMFPAEARGLNWLRAADALPTPTVVAVSEPSDKHRFLVLDWVEAKAPHPLADELFGRGLARLHRSGAPSFGLDHNNFIGLLPQQNTPVRDGVQFLIRRRLRPQLRRAVDAGYVSTTTQRAFARLETRIARMLPDEPPARLHGDLWSGNRLSGPDGQSWLIDPAVYGGPREVDLAMMRLFGGFSQRCFDAYAEVWPLPPGHQERVHLFQLYPLLVHANLFGPQWIRQIEVRLKSLV